MSRGRHRAPRPTPARRPHRWALVAAPLATAAVVAGGIVLSDGAGDNGSATTRAGGVFAATESAASLGEGLVDLGERAAAAARADRSADRKPAAQKKQAEQARAKTERATPRQRTAGPVRTQKRWTTVDLNVWTGPGEQHELVTVLDAGDRVMVTGEQRGIWAQVVHEGQLRYVKAAYLVSERAEAQPAVSAGASSAPCIHGSSVESGMGANAVAVYRAVCGAFPDISSYGGWRGDGEHAAGRALDIMVSGDRGWQVAEWVRARAGELSVSEVIYAQRIWTVERSGEGWRWMEDRGSSTANHYDHVHVTTY